MNKNVKIAKELIKIAKNLIASDSPNEDEEKNNELPDNLSAKQFFETYIKDNEVFSEMPDKCWDYIEKNAKQIYNEALSNYGNEWEVTQKAVRTVLNKNGLDGKNW